MVNLEWYRSFLAIYRAGTVSGAARALFLTQPAVTQHLAVLERVLGEPLFQRASRRMLPTPRGKQLYAQVVQALETLEQVSQEAQSVPVGLPLLRCGAPREYFTEVVLEHMLALPYRLWLHFGETQALIEELEHERLDMVIATQQIASRDVEYYKVDEEHFRLVGPSDFSFPTLDANFSAEKRLEIIEQLLANQKWISYGIELPIIRRFWQQSFGKRPAFQATVIMPDLQAVSKAVQKMGGISVLPDYLCRRELEAGQLCIVWEPPQRVSNELWLAYRKLERNDTRIKQLRRIFDQAHFSVHAPDL